MKIKFNKTVVFDTKTEGINYTAILIIGLFISLSYTFFDIISTIIQLNG